MWGRRPTGRSACDRTYAPLPWRVTIRCSSLRIRSAAFTVSRATPYRLPSSCCDGSRSPGANRCVRIAARSRLAICWDAGRGSSSATASQGSTSVAISLEYGLTSQARRFLHRCLAWLVRLVATRERQWDQRHVSRAGPGARDTNDRWPREGTAFAPPDRAPRRSRDWGHWPARSARNSCRLGARSAHDGRRRCVVPADVRAPATDRCERESCGPSLFPRCRSRPRCTPARFEPSPWRSSRARARRSARLSTSLDASSVFPVHVDPSEAQPAPAARWHMPVEVTPPKYVVIINALQGRIEDGTYPAGALLPSEATLTREFAAARPTVVRALEYLRQQGWIESS